MREAEERFEIFSAFRMGIEGFLSMPAIPEGMRYRHSTISHRIAEALRPFFPSDMSIDVDLNGADITIWDGNGCALALFWAPSYIHADVKRKAIAFHERYCPSLTLAFSLFSDRPLMLVYRIGKGYIEYLHIGKETSEEKVLRRCTIDEGKADDGQLRLPIHRKRRKRLTSSQDR